MWVWIIVVPFLSRKDAIETYVSVFVCHATQAVHLELDSDSTTGAFLACLKRFFTRKGASASISSDNAINFVGVSRELRELYQEIHLLEKEKETQSFLLKTGLIGILFHPELLILEDCGKPQ